MSVLCTHPSGCELKDMEKLGWARVPFVLKQARVQATAHTLQMQAQYINYTVVNVLWMHAHSCVLCTAIEVIGQCQE